MGIWRFYTLCLPFRVWVCVCAYMRVCVCERERERPRIVCAPPWRSTAPWSCCSQRARGQSVGLLDKNDQRKCDPPFLKLSHFASLAVTGIVALSAVLCIVSAVAHGPVWIYQWPDKTRCLVLRQSFDCHRCLPIAEQRKALNFDAAFVESGGHMWGHLKTNICRSVLSLLFTVSLMG